MERIRKMTEAEALRELFDKYEATLDEAMDIGVGSALIRISAQAERDLICAMLREPSDELIEKFSRLHHPGPWKKVDENIDDDDWGGGTALNLRHAMLRDARIAMCALADLICDTTNTGGENV